jgi:hypothetical protein
MALMVDASLNGQLDDLMDESLSCLGRWLKKIMKQVTVVTEENGVVKQISNTEFYIYGHRS